MVYCLDGGDEGEREIKIINIKFRRVVEILRKIGVVVLDEIKIFCIRWIWDFIGFRFI